MFLGRFAEASCECLIEDVLESFWGDTTEIGVLVGDQNECFAHDVRIFRGLVGVHDIEGIGFLQAFQQDRRVPRERSVHNRVECRVLFRGIQRRPERRTERAYVF